MSPEITVVVPTRNRRSVLATTLGTIVAQRDVDLRIIVVDEGSTDGTPEYLGAIADPRFEIVRHDDPKGLAGARNAGLERTTTRWVAFCDDDDLWSPDKLRSQLDELERVPGAQWACVGTVSIDEHLQVIGYHRPPASGDVHALLQGTNVVPGGGSSLLVDADLARDVGGYQAWATGCEDFAMHCRLAARSPLASVDHPYVGYRVWPAGTGSMSTNVERMRTGHLRVIERHRGDIARETARDGDRHAEQYWARFHLRNRDRARAFAAYVKLAARYRLPGQLAYAVWGAVSPESADRYQAKQERAAVPAAWEAEGRAWLDHVEAFEPRLAA